MRAQLNVRKLLCLIFALLATLSVLTPIAGAEPAWQDANFIWWNNMCRAPSGAWWLYPIVDAQPVGTACSIPGTGEVGVVTMR
jgi:hypothetical protein